MSGQYRGKLGLEGGVSHTKSANQIRQLSLTSLEREMVIGCLLGDGTLSRSGKNYRLRIEHSVKHSEYVTWKYGYLKRICISPVQHVVSHSSLRFGTVGHPQLSLLRHVWYQTAKQIPNGLELTPFIIAIWFMDDGTKHRDTVDISIHSFSRASIEKLQKQLLKFRIDTTVNSDSKGPRLYIRKKSYPNFKKLVSPYIQKCIAYKLP